MENVADRLHDLSWLDMPDLGWFIVGELPPPPPEATREELIRQEAWDRLRACDWTMCPDEPLTAGERAEWREHRAELRQICRMKAFPADFQFPDQPRAPLSYPFQ